MTGGFYKMHRGWMDSPVFGKSPFSDREAWIWLIENAAFADHARRLSGELLTIKRGQLSHSLRFMATAWKWQKDRVSRFLRRLQKHEMILLETATAMRQHDQKTATESATGQTLISICNYLYYQDDRSESATASETRVRQHIPENRDSDATNYKKGKKNNSYTVEFETFWAAYPKRGDHSNPKKPAGQLFAAAIKQGIPAETIIQAAANYARYIDREGKAGTDKVAQAQTWLRQERWQDHQEALAPQSLQSRMRAVI